MRTKKPLRTFELRAIESTLYEKTGARLKRCLIEQAFTRSSYAARYGGASNEIFEYIGDTVIGYHVVHALSEHYGTLHLDESECSWTFRAHEKDFSELKSRIVGNRTLAAIIDEWDLCKYLVVGQSDVDNEVDKQEKIKADLFEAIIGAYAVQYKWSKTVMEKIVDRVLPVGRFILDYEKEQYRPAEFSAENAVTKLKELAEHGECPFPVYDIHGPEALGYNSSGAPIWHCGCTVAERGIIKGVFANSKKDAKRFAAYLVLCDMFELPNEYGPSRRLLIWTFDGKTLRPDNWQGD